MCVCVSAGRCMCVVVSVYVCVRCVWISDDGSGVFAWWWLCARVCQWWVGCPVAERVVVCVCVCGRVRVRVKRICMCVVLSASAWWVVSPRSPPSATTTTTTPHTTHPTMNKDASTFQESTHGINLPVRPRLPWPSPCPPVRLDVTRLLSSCWA